MLAAGSGACCIVAVWTIENYRILSEWLTDVLLKCWVVLIPSRWYKNVCTYLVASGALQVWVPARNATHRFRALGSSFTDSFLKRQGCAQELAGGGGSLLPGTCLSPVSGWAGEAPSYLWGLPACLQTDLLREDVPAISLPAWSPCFPQEIKQINKASHLCHNYVFKGYLQKMFNFGWP